MSTPWVATFTRTFYTVAMTLTAKNHHQIHKKIGTLMLDPTPDGKSKVPLKYHPDAYRLRCGDYRVLYTYSHLKNTVNLLEIRHRDEHTYDDEIIIEDIDASTPEINLDPPRREVDWDTAFIEAAPQAIPLPQTLTIPLLTSLHVPTHYHNDLLAARTEDDLLIGCAHIPQDALSPIIEYLYPPSIEQIMEQPQYVLQNVDDLLRIKDGELLHFLLQLSPEQERLADWALNANGPTLLKGGPGTGKSTIALYRVRSLINILRKSGKEHFRILFTTFTNALVNASKEQLGQLLGEDIKYVEVTTPDKIAMRLMGQNHVKVDLVQPTEEPTFLKQAIDGAVYNGNKIQQASQKRAIERLQFEYLQQEINQVILARQITTLEAYKDAARPGRRLPLNPLQREAVWTVAQTFIRLMQEKGKFCWEELRSHAEQFAAQGKTNQLYDAIIVDEAQDLSPSILRMFVHLCPQANRIFITADANQSIYGSGFNWNDVHAQLRFQGRTAILHKNYRTTKQIGEATLSYLSQGTIDNEQVKYSYVNTGGTPALRTILGSENEIQILADYFMNVTRQLALSLGSCAILCPSKAAGTVLAQGLKKHGLQATFMPSNEVNISDPGIKILTLQAAKGLEFPIVVLAGFSNVLNRHTLTSPGEENEELTAKDRRIIFVGMTRAMRSLLVLLPEKMDNPVYKGFDARFWNYGEKGL